jgi:membrane-bound lytic murein transglycosylase D
MGLGHLYFPLFEQVLDQQGLPLELKYLAIVESALNPVAVSCVGATGLWQFMLSTGRLYNLKVNSYIDERKDPEKATLAACQYFKDMYAIYKDWLLVIASYNCGPGNVNKAIARAGGKTDFWSISPYLPRETRGYVPAFIAVTYLMHYTAEHNLTAVPPIINYYEADTIMLHQGVSLRQVALSINVDEELLRYLNPVYKKGIVPELEEPCALRLPSNKVNLFLANQHTIMSPEFAYADPVARIKDEPGVTYVSKTVKKYHKVKRGERMSTLADRYDCSVQDIKRWNKLRSTKISTGQRLAVYVTVRQKVAAPQTAKAEEKPKTDSAAGVAPAGDSSLQAASPADTQQLALQQAQKNQAAADKYFYHVVQPGDTLWNIAMRYDGNTVQQLRKINRLNSNALKVGTKLKVKAGG